jgi:transposase InsO family protein
MRDIAAATCADTLFAGWISRYGVPVQLTSDRGTQFTSAIWDALCQQLGIQHQPSTAFHPQANGMVERSPLYSGPYKLFASGPKVFGLQVGKREESVSA